MAYIIYTYLCRRCGHVWHRKVLGTSVGYGNQTNPCPNCGNGNVRKVGEQRINR